MAGIAPITPALGPAVSSPELGTSAAVQAQTPQSRYLAAALQQIGHSLPLTGTALGTDLLSEALLRSAQNREAAYGPSGANAQKNAATSDLNSTLTTAGITPPDTTALPTAAPTGGLLGLGAKIKSGLTSVLGGANG